MKTRIVKRTNVDGRQSWVIQQRHFIFWFWWVDAWINSSDGASCNDRFSSYSEAQANLCYFDGTTSKDEVVS